MGIICVLQLCIVMACITVASQLQYQYLLGSAHKQCGIRLSRPAFQHHHASDAIKHRNCMQSWVDHAASQEWQSNVERMDLKTLPRASMRAVFDTLKGAKVIEAEYQLHILLV